MLRTSALIGVLFNSFPRPPEAISSKYVFEIDDGISPDTEFRFYWTSRTADDAFKKAINTARFFDEYAMRKGWEMRAYSYDRDREKITCEEWATEQSESYKEDLRKESLINTQSIPQMYISCTLDAHVPGVQGYELVIHERGGSIQLPN